MNGSEYPERFSPDGLTEQVIDVLLREEVGQGARCGRGVGDPAAPGHVRFGEVLISSFSYLHGPAPETDITVDVRRHLRDPHIDPGLRQLTGHDTAVRTHVLATAGASGLIEGVVTAAMALLAGARATGGLVRVAVGCAGGRHRSVVLVEEIAQRLALAGWGVRIEHLHLHKAVVARS